MRALVVIGILLVVAGLIAVAIPSFTYFTTERVADVGFFTVDLSRPHTVVINPIAGGAMAAAGIVLVLIGLRRNST